MSKYEEAAREHNTFICKNFSAFSPSQSFIAGAEHGAASERKKILELLKNKSSVVCGNGAATATFGDGVYFADWLEEVLK